MKRYIDELSKRFDRLLKTYEQFIWKDKNRKLSAVFYEECVVAFTLFDGEEEVDQLYINFDEGEKSLFLPVCLQIFKLMLGNVRVYTGSGDNEHVYYNEKIKPYFLIVSTSNEVTQVLDSLVADQGEHVIDNSNNIIKSANNKARKYMVDKTVLNELDKRISFSSELLRRY